MSWFEKAKTVLIEALDIQDDDKKSDNDATTSAFNAKTALQTDETEQILGVDLATTAKTTTSSTAAGGITTANATTPTNSFTGAFFDNPNANEMVTIPPRASDAGAPTTNKLTAKRQSAASDSVDLLSTPTSPSDDANVNINSESSLELITATTASDIAASPDTEPSLPDSIVIIASNDTSDNADGDAEGEDDDHPVVGVGEQSLLHLNDSTKTIKSLVLNEGQNSSAGADSDSTQSFEDIQMHISHKSKTSVSVDDNGKAELVDQSYSSTSSDIEIISNPNGDSSNASTNARISPLKLKELGPKQKDTVQSIVQLKSKGHHREPSEISLLSEDSQSELDKVVQRISELNQIIEAREQRLLQSERQNAELIERNQELQAAIDAVRYSANSTDANEAVQRLSALEKKFQSSIRERDALRIQIKTLRDELQNKIPKDELSECNEMIAALQSEGEKLSKEILQQSNIIKKLRAKEKTSDTLLKKNGEQVSQLSSETERLKKSLAAKDEVERTQIEAVHKMTTEKRLVDEENAKLRSQIEDLQSKLHALQTSFHEIKNDMQKRARQEEDKSKVESQQLMDMREKMREAEMEMVRRELHLREEKQQLMRRLEESELRAELSTQEMSISTAPLIRQIESLQKILNHRTSTWNKEEQSLLQKLEHAQNELKALKHIVATHNDKYELQRNRCVQLEEQLSAALMQTEHSKIAQHQIELETNLKEVEFKRQINELREELKNREEKLEQLERQCKDLEALQQLRNQKQHQVSELTVAALRAADDHHNNSELQQQQQQQLQNQNFAHEHQRQASHYSQQTRGSPALSQADSCSNDDALGGIVDWQTDDIDCISNSGRQHSGVVQGVHLNFLAHNTTTLEHLQSLLKQRDGELTHLQWELSRLQAGRSVLNEEISNLTIELENSKEQLRTFENMEKTYADLQHRYDALLQMYGEKVERTEELELDLVELKQAYKLQIDELLAQPVTTQQQGTKQQKPT